MAIDLMASVLTADLSALKEECQRFEAAGMDGIQWDVMDGVAVPGMSFGPDLIAACRPHTSLEFEAHVMVRDPSSTMLDGLRDAGCGRVIVHTDMLSAPWRTLEAIREREMAAGIALSPAIPVCDGRWLFELVDLVLVMTVEPGFGGQPYLRHMEHKVAELRAELDQRGYAEAIVEVDGGIAPATIEGSFAAGADRFIVGSALWRGASFEAVVDELRSRCAAIE